MRSLRDGLLLAALAALPLALPLRLLGATFAHPWGLGLFGLALPVILLHMLRPKRTPLTIGSVLLWREVEKALDSRHPFERLRRNLPLFLELLALAALAFALATPRLRGGRGSGRDCVLVFDASASMKTRDGPDGITRFEAARREGRAVVRGLRAGERGLVIVATPRGARTAQAWTEDTGALEDAIAALEPSDGGAELGDALVPAAAAARAVDRSVVIVFSDGGDRPLPAIDFQDRLRYRGIGASDENLGIVSAERSQGLSTRDPSDPSLRTGSGSVLVSVVNSGAHARKAWVELLSADRKTLAVRSADVPARSRIALVLEAELAPPFIIARVSPADGAPDLLASDDEVPLVVPAGDAPAVLVESSSKPLLRALEAARARVTSGPLDASVRLEIVSGGDKLDPVPCLVLDAKSDVGPVKLGEELTAPKIAAWDRDERLLRYVSLEDVELKRARKLVLGPGARPLIATDEGPIAAVFTDHDVLRVVLGFDLAETSWPLRLSFPIFVRNLVEAALEEDVLAPRATVRAGSVVSLRSSGAEVVVTTPRGREVRLPVDDGRALFAETDENGVYQVRAVDRTGAFAVATLDEHETRIAPRERLAIEGSTQVLSALEPGEREVVAPFLLLALAAVTVEAFAASRRW